MGCIVCATRGGEGSRAVQMAAIERAKATASQLIFLYVTDPYSLGPIEDVLITAVREELSWMGNTLLRVAQQRAAIADVEARIVVRTGDVREEIGRFLHESHANLLLLGAPRGTTANVFGDDAVEQFAMGIQGTTGITVEVIRPESRQR